jgi:iron-sulfur cluster repair protein YtfE (RIC family)
MNEVLSRDHAEIDVLLEDALNKLRSEDFAEAFRALDLFWARLAMHIRAEHLHLFPAVMRISGSEAAEIVERLRHDHDFFMRELADIIKAMRVRKEEIMRETGRRLEAIKARLAEHNEVEEAQIYPWFVWGEDEQLSRSIKKELGNLPRRFANRVEFGRDSR